MVRGNYFKYFFVLSLSLFLVIFIKPLHAFAASQDLTISPAVSQIKVNPGQSVSGSFLIINQGDGTYSFNVYATPYNVTGQDYTPDYKAIPGAVDVSSWFKFSIESGSVAPGQTEKVNYTLSVPAGTQDGGYYAVAFGQTNNPKALIGVTINERVGMLFLMQVGDKVVKKGLLQTWQSNFFQSPPLTSNIKIENSGSIYFRANFQYKVSDLFGNTKYLLNGQKFILPQTVRNLSLPWNKSPSFGLFKVSGNVNFLGKNQYLGTKYVLVMSKAVRIYTGIIISLIIVSYIAFSLGRRKRKKQNHRKKRN